MGWLRRLWIPTKDEELAAAEDRLLSQSGTKVEVYQVHIDDENHIHTVEAGQTHKNTSQTPPLVLCHGFGMGVGGWYMNYGQLAEKTHVYAIDWLGMGRSSRPKYPCKTLEETEAYFTKSLDDWREKQNIDKMVLCGHSLGGYFATVYALKHPERVEHLILASPAGVPMKPEKDVLKERLDTLPPVKRFFLKSAVSSVSGLWNAGYSPQDLIRFFGPLGPRLIRGYANNRFANPDVDKEGMGEYLYHNAAAKGSGEYSLPSVLEPFAFARKPLCLRLPEMKVPVTFIYGEHDWMDARNADEVKPKMKVPTSVVRLPNSGHQLFLDNPVAFNQSILRVLGSASKAPEKTGSGMRLSWLNQDDVTLSVQT